MSFHKIKNEVNKDFEILKRDKNLFKLVKIDIQGYGIYWNDYLDISCNEIYYNNWKIKYLIYLFYIKKLVIAKLDKGVAIQTKQNRLIYNLNK